MNITQKQRNTNKINLLNVIHSFSIGGSETYAINISLNLDKSIYNPMVCALDNDGPFSDILKTNNIPNFHMDRKPGIDLYLIFRLYNLFRSQKVNVVHTHHFTQLFYSIIPAKLVGARLIHTEHDMFTFAESKVKPCFQLLSHFCYKIVAISSGVANALQNKANISLGHIDTIPFGINLNQYNILSKSLSKIKLGFESFPFIISIVARLSPEKNHILLLNSFSRVINAYPNAHLLIIGDGPQYVYILEHIHRLNLHSNVHMLGLRQDILNILSATDIFVLSSKHEGLPIAILEAMAAGLPVVSTDVGDVGMAVKNGENGILVPPGNAEAYADAILELMQDSDKRKVYGRKGRELVLQKYSMDAMVKRYEELYTE